ncbi:DUF58 domain-containing protein [Thiospirochaeta perfilievii]|uniref:DUF58 domain-containing protein n=1 Tax=Thiospirochaeta perfilievii TaxID=252967 RepID=A0A5C1QFE9_9SPIO|nr:DUF58 domain-containing protein [Thiospirochaeta perfilievii]QEN06138.1 DUF58 domain-containing protein [Thiospirochaeta perfilievii]
MEKNFTKEVLKKVKNLEIKTKNLVNDALAGHYHSVFKGQGMNFSEIREYVNGDDVKNIDWNVTARQGTPHIKKYNEERERTIILMVDISPSTIFGSAQSKKELIAELSSVLAFSAEKNNDKVGLILFTDRIELFIPPAKSRTHLLRIIRELLFFKPVGKKTDILKVLNFVNKTFSKTVVAFLISDFSINNLPDNFKTKIKSSGKHHDLISVRVKDQNEIDIPSIGIITLEDLESGEIVEVDTNNSKTRKVYKELIKKRDDNISNIIKACGVDLLDINTNQDYMPTLLKFFTLRERRA